MDIQAEKLELMQAILNIEDIGLIKKVKKLISKRAESHDWFDDLTDEQQQSVMRGLEQADRGEFISHEEASARLGL
jgi:predicted transcriptional regulator